MHEQGKRKCRNTSIFFFFNGWPVPPGWKPPLTQRHGNTVKPSPAHPHKERARESRGWGELYPACTTRVLFGATELRFWQPHLHAHRGKKRQGTQPQLFTLIGNKYTNNESICRHYGGSWATWKRCLETNKEKKTFFFFLKQAS